jgi:hypothetical protein
VPTAGAFVFHAGASFRAAYPGLTRGAVELLGNKVAARTIRSWRQGTRYKPPLWAIEILQAFLRRRAEHELACVEELEKEKVARFTAP